MQQGSVAKYQAFSAYQKAARDIALVIDENIPANDLINSIHSLNQNFIWLMLICLMFMLVRILNLAKRVLHLI